MNPTDELVALGLRRLSGDLWTLRLSYSEHVYSFVCTITATPILSVDAPHSLWRLLEGTHGGARNLSALAQRTLRGDVVEFPVLLGQPTLGLKLALPEDQPPWPKNSQHGCFLAAPELTWSLLHLTRDASNTLFPRPFEHVLLHEAQSDTLRVARQQNLLQYSLSAFRQIDAPKHTIGTRTATQLTPEDALLFTSLVVSCADLIEKARAPIDRGTVYSFRFEPSDNGYLWSRRVGHQTFEEATEARLHENDVHFVAEADIEAFYHRISARVVELRLNQIGVHPKIATALGQLLGTFSEVGLPVGPSASALLAESVLAVIDDEFDAARVQYVRFNDDFRIFGSSEAECQSALNLLEATLARLGGLRLQKAKTAIYDARSYRRGRGPWRRGKWMRDLTKAIAADHTYGTGLNARNEHQSKSALSVFRKSIADSADPWLRFAHRSFGALAMREKIDATPDVLGNIDRLWPLSADAAMALRAAPMRGQLQSTVLIPDFSAAIAELGDRPGRDFALVWILDAISRSELRPPGIEEMAGDVPINSPAFREAVLVASPLVDLAGAHESPWIRRARAHITGKTPVSRASDPESDFQRFILSLCAVKR